MSKTVEIQIEKSRSLIEGLRRHVREMGERGVSSDEINEMDQAIKMLGVPLFQPLFSLLMNSSNGSSAEQHVSRDTDVTSIVKIKNFLIFFASFIFVAKIGRRSILPKSIQRAA